jgi:hypothetical protein
MDFSPKNEIKKPGSLGHVCTELDSFVCAVWPLPIGPCVGWYSGDYCEPKDGNKKCTNQVLKEKKLGSFPRNYAAYYSRRC